MKKGSTLFLRIALFVIAIPPLVICLILFPSELGRAIEEAIKGGTIGYMVLSIAGIVYLSVIPFYFTLFQAFKLLNYIDKGKAFSELSVLSLKKIRNCAAIISGLYILVLPPLFVIAEWDDAPGLVLIGMVIIGASMVIAVFAAVLKKLLNEAIQIKSEIDLTV